MLAARLPPLPRDCKPIFIVCRASCMIKRATGRLRGAGVRNGRRAGFRFRDESRWGSVPSPAPAGRFQKLGRKNWPAARPILGAVKSSAHAVTERSAAGLSGNTASVVPANRPRSQGQRRLDDIKGRVQLGFRRARCGRHLKRLYGSPPWRRCRGAVREANSKIVTDTALTRHRAEMVLPVGRRAPSRASSPAKSDLAYTVKMEIVPPLTLADFKTPRDRAGSRRRSPTKSRLRRCRPLGEQNRRVRRQGRGCRKTAIASPFSFTGRWPANPSKAAPARIPHRDRLRAIIPGFEGTSDRASKPAKAAAST